MKKYNVAILGATGAVGTEFLKLIEERNFPFNELRLLASKRSAGKVLKVCGKDYTVEEATKDARKVAEKFAKDAGCQLGSIINATQGQFTVEEEYYRPQYKQIRVVTTISYYLK